jgi:hypothetical protein
MLIENLVLIGYTPLTPITSVKNKLDPSDTELKTLIDNNQSWAEAVTKAEPTYFKEMALKQEPKILWIGKNDTCLCHISTSWVHFYLPISCWGQVVPILVYPLNRLFNLVLARFLCTVTSPMWFTIPI